MLRSWCWPGSWWSTCWRSWSTSSSSDLLILKMMMINTLEQTTIMVTLMITLRFQLRLVSRWELSDFSISYKSWSLLDEGCCSRVSCCPGSLYSWLVWRWLMTVLTMTIRNNIRHGPGSDQETDLSMVPAPRIRLAQVGHLRVSGSQVGQISGEINFKTF